MTTGQRQETGEQVGYWTLWTAVMGGLVVWSVRLVVGASIVGYACQAGRVGVLVLWLMSAAGVALTVVALLWCVRIRRRAARLSDDASWSAAAFAAAVGVLMNAISLALILAESVSIAFIPPCQSL